MTVGFVNYKHRRRGETRPAHGPLGVEPEIPDHLAALGESLVYCRSFPYKGGLDPDGVFSTLAVRQRGASRKVLRFAQLPHNAPTRIAAKGISDSVFDLHWMAFMLGGLSHAEFPRVSKHRNIVSSGILYH